MITLLSETDRANVRAEYRLRLFCTAALMFAVVCAVEAIALLPSYFSARLMVTAAAQDAQLLERTLDNPSLANAGKSVRSSQALLAAVSAAATVPRPSGIIASIASARVSGVSIVREEYVLREEAVEVHLSGVAGTRDELLQFRQSLGALPGVSNVDLPIDNLAKAADITYTILISVPFSHTP